MEPTTRCQLHYSENNTQENLPFIAPDKYLKKSYYHKTKRRHILIIATIQICIVLLWLLHEGIKFDHSCSAYLSENEPIVNSSLIYYRVSRSINQPPEILTFANGTKVKVVARKKKVVVRRRLSAGNMDLEESSEETDFTKSPYGRLVGRKIVRVRITTPDPLEDEHEERRKRPIQRRYHLLSGGVQGNSVPFPTSGAINKNKEAKSNNWLHGIVNSNDPAFSNKGEIRAVNMKQAKRRPKVQLDKLKEKFSKSKSGNNVSESRALSKTEVEVPEVITLFGGPASLNNDIKKDIEKNTEKSIEKDVSQNSPIISDSISSGNEKDVFKEEQMTSEVVMDETVKEQTTKDAEGDEAEEKDMIEYKIIDVAKETSTMATFDYQSGWDVAENEYEEGEFQVNKDPTRETLTAPKPRPVKGQNFANELHRHFNNSFCIIRTFFAFWCIGQVSALIFFIIAATYTISFLFIPQIVVETLLILLSSIYGFAISVFSVSLYFLVDDMTFTNLFKWLLFGFIIFVISIIHAWILSKKITYMKESKGMINDGERQSQYIVSNEGSFNQTHVANL